MVRLKDILREGKYPSKFKVITKASIDKKGNPKYEFGKSVGWYVPYGGVFKTKKRALEYIEKNKLKRVM